jgi:hypothetical protein
LGNRRWQEELFRGTKLSGKSLGVPLGADDVRDLQLGRDGRGSHAYSAASNAVLASDSFEFGEPEFHRDDEGIETISEGLGLFGLVPVGEVGIGGVGVFDDEVLDSVFQIGGPSDDAFDAGGVRGDDAHSGEGNTELEEVVFHELEPLVSDESGAAAHIGEDDVGLAVGEDGKEDIEGGIGMDVDLLGIREIVAEGTEGFVFGVEVERKKRDLAGLVPVGDSEGNAGFSDAAFAAGGEDDAFFKWWPLESLLSIGSVLSRFEM